MELRAAAMRTRVERNGLMPEGIKLFNMSAGRDGATQLNGAHRAPLRATEAVGVGLPILRAAAAEDVRHFQWRAHARAQKYSGAADWEGMGSGCGSRSKGLVVAHTVLVASFK